MRVPLSVTRRKGLGNLFYLIMNNTKVIFRETECMDRAGSIQKEDKSFMESGRIQDW